ncbi:MAG TPA: PH domain-containing protein [Stellaceae bacterium]|nr:PH domain-containing protein [Stellaceae bacterium]
MRYVVRVLQPGETILLTAHLHPIIYFRALLHLIVALVLLITAYQFTNEMRTILQVVALTFVLFAAGEWARAAIRQVTTDLAVTDRRVIYKTGLISRHTLEMNRSKVESVDVNQSLLGRLLGFGTVIVRGTGGSLEPVRLIRDPLRFRSTITAS